jgi:predicted MPP superfamily phosphohydrolase
MKYSKTKKSVRVLRLFLISLIFVAIAASVAVVGVNYVGNRDFKETFYCVSSLKVNNKIRVVQLSDLHNCVYGKDNQHLIDRVQKLQPDLILYTGDGINAIPKGEDATIRLCEALAKVAPSYYIYGNNEIERLYDVPLTQDALDEKFAFTDETRDPKKLLEMEDAFEAQLEKVGVKVLKNEADTLTIGSTTVDVYGVLTSNPSAFWSYGGENFDSHIYENERHLKITAIHEPTVFEQYAPESWGDVMFAGHTHGGLIKVPMLGPLYTKEGGLLPARSGYFVYGRYDVQGRPLIVSSGLENQHLLRINNRPEVVIVDINKF